MSHLIAFNLDAAGTTEVLVEASDDPGRKTGQIKVSRGGVKAEEAGQALDAALAGITPIAQTVVNALRSAVADAIEVQVEFGIKLSASAGVILAKAAAEGHCKVAVKWSKK